MVASSDAANPRVPVPKSRVVSLSPTFAGRDLMLWRLKSHIWELSYWESPSASSKFTLFPFRTHQPKSELKLEHVRFVPEADILRFQTILGLVAYARSFHWQAVHDLA